MKRTQWKPKRSPGLGILRTVLLVTMFIGLAMGGVLALIEISRTISIQALWTVFTLVILITINIHETNTLTKYERALTLTGIGITCVAAISIGAGYVEPSSISYLVSFAVFLLASAISRFTFSVETLLQVLFWASGCVSVLGLMCAIFYPDIDDRIVQMTVSFASVFIFARLATTPVSFLKFLLASAFLLSGAASIYLEAARSAGLLVFLSAIALLLAARSVPLGRRCFIVIGQFIMLLVVFGTKEPQKRWFGGDSALIVGGVELNSNGRLALAKASLLPNAKGLDAVDILLGRGLGTAADASIPLVGAPTPLNEFVRVGADLGAIGVISWIVVLFSIYTIGFRLFLRSKERSFGVTVLLLASGLTIFSLTESMISYSWVLLPCALFIGSVRINPRYVGPLSSNLHLRNSVDSSPSTLKVQKAQT